jgi:pyruvate kinase
MHLKEKKKTKVVCTIGPASSKKETIEKLVKSGMNVCRLNFSHGTYNEHKEKLKLIRAVSKKTGYPIAVIQDLGGPKIRTGEIPGKGIRLNAHDTIALSGTAKQAEDGVLPISYSKLAKDVKTGDAILLADGSIELKVARIKGNLVYCKVLVGGIISSHKGVNIPSEALSVPGLTAKDKKDILFAVKEKVDFLALSFVRSEKDVLSLKRILKKHKADIPVIAKIEKPQALDHIDKIIEASDGIMVARGDLGVEIPFNQVPIVQKMLIRKANKAGKPVITATQMLSSMVNSPRPTRAEVTDVANAILDGTDAVMLSEETAVGKYPVKAVEAMTKIAKSAEREMMDSLPLCSPYHAKDIITDSISYSAYMMSEEMKTRAIICPTRSGMTAKRISRYRPDPPILALTPSENTFRAMCLTWGTFPVLIPDLTDPTDVTAQALAWAKKTVAFRKGDIIIITAGTNTSDPGTTNTIRLEKI